VTSLLRKKQEIQKRNRREEKANSNPHAQDVRAVEGAIPKNFGQDAVEVPGSRALLDNLERVSAPWSIVTSGTRPLVQGWIDVMGLAQPKNLITAEDVPRGKPDPACYRLGARTLGFDFPDDDHVGGDKGSNANVNANVDGNANAQRAEKAKDDILVLEDAPAGVRAGKAAGFKVVALATTHEVQLLIEAGADWIVRDMRSVTLSRYDQKTKNIEIEISNALRI